MPSRPPPQQSTGSDLRESWDAALANLPGWSDLLVEVEFTSSDYVEGGAEHGRSARAATAPQCPSAALHNFGYGAAHKWLRCLSRCDEDGMHGAVRVLVCSPAAGRNARPGLADRRADGLKLATDFAEHVRKRGRTELKTLEQRAGSSVRCGSGCRPGRRCACGARHLLRDAPLPRLATTMSVWLALLIMTGRCFCS